MPRQRIDELASAFPRRHRAFRKERSFTQQTLAGANGLGIAPMARYERDALQATFEAIRKLSQALRVSAYELLFGTAERRPDEDLRLQFETISRFNDEEKKVVRLGAGRPAADA